LKKLRGGDKIVDPADKTVLIKDRDGEKVKDGEMKQEE
jgi:hypothetical protein